jgi:hypothetical protein
MAEDFMKRGYLLPKGCKDLIDVLQKAKQPSKPPLLLFDLWKLWKRKNPIILSSFKPTKPFWKPSASNES